MRRSPAPLLDLRLLRNRTFGAAVIGGSIFRIGAGAVPFLLPLLFQVGFGMTPFQSGMLTFASAIGAIGLKFFAARILRYGGFRRVMVFSALAGAAMIAVNGWFSPATPIAVILLILVVAGFLRSLFFTSVNALMFADTATADAAQATAIGAVMQQVSIAVGVAVAGAILEGVTTATGEPLDAFAFRIAFMRMAPSAGAGVSGHHIEAAGPGGRTPARRP
jgi:MFS family permease